MASLLARTGLALAGLLVLAPAAGAMNIQRVVSPAGVEAWLVEDYAVPIIAVNFAFAGGTAQDPAGKPGVASMMTSLLDEGAGDLDSRAFQARLDDQSIEMSFDSGRDDVFGKLKTLSENRGEAFRLLALALQSPRFDTEPVERIRAQIRMNIKQAATDPESAAMLALGELAFPGHPYGNPPDGTDASVAAITTADLKAYHDRVFARDNLKVAIVGAIAPAEAAAMLDRVFGPLPARADLAPVPEVVPAAGLREIEQPIPQALVRFGGPGIGRGDPDLITAYVVNHILGGGTFSSRLYKEVREKHGLAYTISTGLATMAHSSAIAGGTATRADRVDETLGIIRSEIARFAAEGPTEEELAKAKSYMIGSYALRFDSSSKIAGQLLGIQLDGNGIDYVEKRNDLIAAVTIEDAKRVAKRLMSNAADTIVIVGPKKAEAKAEAQPKS